MDTAKAALYTTLSTLPYAVSQGSQAEFAVLPALTFAVTSNVPNINLDKQINGQNLEIIIDLWATTSVEASAMVQTVEALLRENNYVMTFNADVPNTNEISHIVMRFKTVLC